MFDRGDTGPNGYLNAFGAVCMGGDSSPERCSFVDDRFHFFVSELRCAHGVAFAQDTSGLANLDHIRAVLDLITDDRTALLRAIRNAVLNAVIKQAWLVSVLITVTACDPDRMTG